MNGARGRRVEAVLEQLLEERALVRFEMILAMPHNGAVVDGAGGDGQFATDIAAEMGFGVHEVTLPGQTRHCVCNATDMSCYVPLQALFGTMSESTAP